MGSRKRVFRDYLALYREAIRTTRYTELRELQPPPFATLSHGGAGTAYALWRLGEPRRARTWIANILADRTRDAYARITPPDARRSSLMFGRLGARWVHAMIAPAARPSYVRAIAAPMSGDEYATGSAGRLIGAMLVLDRAASPPLERAADRLAERLLAALATRAREPWAAADANGFAHGWAGICYASLGWSARRGATPPWLVDAIVRLAGAWEPARVPDRFVASWCNGAAGALLLWVKAFELTADVRLLEVARRAARTAVETSGHLPGLCCGDAGIAFALLSLARIDPAGGWRQTAGELAARTIAGAGFEHPSGLFQGHPGLACLAQELLDAPRGFPAVEA